MRQVDARTGIEILDEDECLRLLAADEIGRLAVIAGGAPLIFPVNYVLDGTAIVFRTAPGTKLDAGPRSRASFEVDSFDRERRSGWSVVVAGRLEEVTHYDSKTFDRVRHLPIDPWADGDKPHFMRLVTDRMSGRAVTHPQ
jgi:nitroimidazol reductase NimA-like FMN-containing flavoprotein (pyridoxamine 5'-phosphate oxidase superfamily)